MLFFAYKARDARGELIQGVLEGSTSSAVASHLLDRGFTPIDIRPSAQPAATDPASWWSRLNAPAIRSIDVQLFSRQLYTLLKAGVPIMRSLTGLQESATNTSFALVLNDLRESLDGGRELSTAMQQHPGVFSNFYMSMVRVGEMTGRLEEVFMHLFVHLEFERDMNQRVRSALRYPSFVMIAMVLAISVINLFVIPAFSRVYAGFKTELPLMTRLLMAGSDFMVHYWLLMLAVIAIAGFACKTYLATDAGGLRWDKFKLRLPLVGAIILKGTLARFARSFALSNRSGIPIVQGLKVVAQTVDNAFLASRIEQMCDSVERGDSILRSAVTAGVFTPVVLQIIAVGEETGDLDELMNDIADMYEREVDYELKTLASNIEPILIGALGVLVLILALGIFLPIWDLGRVSIKR